MTNPFASLFSPTRIGPMEVKNRLFLAGHGTRLQDANGLTEAYYAYQERRAQGGVGLIVTEILMIDPSTKWNKGSLTIYRDEDIPQYRELADRLHRYDCRVLGQLFHPGMDRMLSEEGTIPVAYSASRLYNERRKLATRAMTEADIADLIDRYAAGAERLEKAGFDGAEISASHGYLPAQFLHAECNHRTDAWGGSPEKRAKFLRDICAAIRGRCGPGFAIGVRLSAGGHAMDALSEEAIVDAAQLLEQDGTCDYISVTDGASSSLSASIDNVPPMGTENLAKRQLAMRLKAAQTMPVMVTGRVTYPALADAVVAAGEADMIGLVRALICDPDFPAKASRNKSDDIRTCIGCNQACIGHNHKGFGISCIQNPETGRETRFEPERPAPLSKTVLVVGGGPAGMKAAVTAARRGHTVTLAEKSGALGGLARLAQLLPGRSEFGGVISNLEKEIAALNIRVLLDHAIEMSSEETESYDAVVWATGSQPRLPDVESDRPLLSARDVLTGGCVIGQKVVIADWSCDWVALGLAEKLAAEGHSVRVAVNGTDAGEAIQLYVRHWMLARAMKLGARFTPYLRFFGFQDRTAYFENLLTQEPVIWEDVDTVIAAYGQEASNLTAPSDGTTMLIGDCLQPRTAEEAILEGFKAGMAI